MLQKIAINELSLKFFNAFFHSLYKRKPHAKTNKTEIFH
jgi:hypothetical protein